MKTRHLVLAIHDYYAQQLDAQQRAMDPRPQQQKSAPDPPSKQHSHETSSHQRSPPNGPSREQLAVTMSVESELWALAEYINLMHLHPISEVLDSDSSGFVTIQEVNRFTVSRPRGWRYARF